MNEFTPTHFGSSGKYRGIIMQEIDTEFEVLIVSEAIGLSPMGSAWNTLLNRPGLRKRTGNRSTP